jgi:uncharacterized membrane protein YhaH (DUF805 family)
MSLTHYLFGFSGRINRALYWRSILAGFGFLAVGVAIAAPYVAIEHPNAAQDHPLSLLGMATIAAEGLVLLAYVVFAFAVLVKRLHDRNRGAWWLLPFVLFPQAIGIAIDPDRPPPQVPVAALLVLYLTVVVLSLWGLIEVGFLRGTVGDNRFGPDPLAGP